MNDRLSSNVELYCWYQLVRSKYFSIVYDSKIKWKLENADLVEGLLKQWDIARLEKDFKLWKCFVFFWETSWPPVFEN